MEQCSSPPVVTFTVEADGRLPSGMTLSEAIATVDLETDASLDDFMINCAHPDHFTDALAGRDSALDPRGASERTCPGSVTPSWTRVPSWTTVTLKSSAPSSSGSRSSIPTSTSWVAAVGRYRHIEAIANADRSFKSGQPATHNSNIGICVRNSRSKCSIAAPLPANQWPRGRQQLVVRGHQARPGTIGGPRPH